MELLGKDWHEPLGISVKKIIRRRGRKRWYHKGNQLQKADISTVIYEIETNE